MIKEYFNKAGGKKILKNYIENNVFIYAILLFLFLPKNKVGFETLREIVSLRIYGKLKKRYKRLLYKEDYQLEEKKIERKVWFCWLQGIENAPKLVKVCYKYLTCYLNDYEIIEITEQNYMKYTTIPEFIIKKWKCGYISNTHFSDILRNNLLINNGGIWIDSTVLLTDVIPDDIMQAPMFLFQTLKPGKDGKSIPISSWFIASSVNNPVLKTAQDLLFAYWKNHNKLCDYFLYHYFLIMSLEKYEKIYEQIPQYTNENPHILLFKLNEEYNKETFDYICNKTFAHKLTYKLDESIQNNKKNFYNYLVEDKND